MPMEEFDYVVDENGRWHYIKAFMHSLITDSSVETFCGEVITLPRNGLDEYFAHGCHGKDMVCYCATENADEEICAWE